jgi:hypothetical protein
LIAFSMNSRISSLVMAWLLPGSKS